MSSEYTLLYNAKIVTMDANNHFYPKGALLIQNNKIINIYPSLTPSQLVALQQEYHPQQQDLHGKYLLPGLINTHVHSVQQLGRGLGDDVDLIVWLRDRIWPYESAMNEKDVYVSTKLMILEQIHSGVTCFADAGGHYVGEMAKACEEMGIRAVLSQSIMDMGEGLPKSWKRTTKECIEIQLENFKRFKSELVRYWFNLRTIFNCSDELVVQTKKLADQFKVGIHMHVAEVKEEVEFCRKTRGETTVKHLHKLGALGPNLLAVHSVWLTDEEIDLYAKYGVKVSHCPAAAMRYLGFAKIPEMIQKNICVSIGTDGAPSNNRMTLIDDAWLANLIHKGRTLDPKVCPSYTILEMITRNAAKCLLWDDQIGSLEKGKAADMIIINPDTANMIPIHDPISNLITCMQSRNVESVMINGKWVMKDGIIDNEKTIIEEAKTRAADIVKRVFGKPNFLSK